ncbi:DUF2188 domain-containing protein [Candidatus Poriferisocius sp.]|uniref:DUF2188 domain-containing protein n=1 Tax=Candidatus Poriferisocius sp. TaxID=3101276 RepID=UPI003B013CBA
MTNTNYGQTVYERDDGRTGVRRFGADRDSKVFDRRNDAIDYAVKRQNEEGGSLNILDDDSGQFEAH